MPLLHQNPETQQSEAVTGAWARPSSEPAPTLAAPTFEVQMAEAGTRQSAAGQARGLTARRGRTRLAGALLPSAPAVSYGVATFGLLRALPEAFSGGVGVVGGVFLGSCAVGAATGSFLRSPRRGAMAGLLAAGASMAALGANALVRGWDTSIELPVAAFLAALYLSAMGFGAVGGWLGRRPGTRNAGKAADAAVFASAALYPVLAFLGHFLARQMFCWDAGIALCVVAVSVAPAALLGSRLRSPRTAAVAGALLVATTALVLHGPAFNGVDLLRDVGLKGLAGWIAAGAAAGAFASRGRRELRLRAERRRAKEEGR